MKNKFLYIILFGLIIAFGSCEPEMDLSDPKTVSVGNYYKNTDEFQMGLIAAYQPLVSIEGMYGRWTYYHFLGLGDDFTPTINCQHPTIVSAVYVAYYSPSAFGIGEVWTWQTLYQGVYACNIIIEKLEPFDDIEAVSAEDKSSILGQAHFLRGLYYLHLAVLYGETVPLVTRVAQTKDEQFPPNTEKGESIIYSFIVEEFKAASALLKTRSETFFDSEGSAINFNYGRATKGSAQGYLARTYLYRPLIDINQEAEFDKAAVMLDSVINSKEYYLMPNFRDNFTDENENNAESLFETQFIVTPNPASGNNRNYSWRMRECGYPRGGTGAPTSSIWWNMAPNPIAYNEFEQGDPRRYMTLWCPDGAQFFTYNPNDTVEFEDNIFGITDEDLYGCRKYCYDYLPTNQDVGINDRLLRYSDILLMRAECAYELGDNGTAIQYIDMVRNRANNIVPTEQPVLWYSKSKGTIPGVEELIAKDTTINGRKIANLKDAIVHERFVEFCGEYLRYLDLRRWAAADHTYNNYLLNKYQGTRSYDNNFDPNKQGALPIPSIELDVNPNVHGNDWN
jgi:hypothetical protein